MDRAQLAEARQRELIAEVVRQEFARALSELRPSSVEFYQNAKGERAVTVKEYGTDARAAYEVAKEMFGRAVAELDGIGGVDAARRPRGERG